MNETNLSKLVGVVMALVLLLLAAGAGLVDQLIHFFIAVEPQASQLAESVFVQMGLWR